MAKTVLITGCSSGIGLAAAERFAALQWQVVATARDVGTLDMLAQTVNVLVLPLDVTDESSITAAIASTVERFGTLDVLVNNAGYGIFGPMEGATDGELEAVFKTNFFGAAAMIRHTLPQMRAQKSGTIINMSSVGGRIATPFAAGYFASKFALEGYSESLRYEVGMHGVLVKLIEPAHFKTGFLGKRLRFTAHPAYEVAFSNYMKWVRREEEKAPGPEPVIEAIVRAATDKSQRLRYPVGGSVLLWMTRWLPDKLWRGMNEMGMTREP